MYKDDNCNDDVKRGSFLENVTLCDNDDGGRWSVIKYDIVMMMSVSQLEKVYDMTW